LNSQTFQPALIAARLSLLGGILVLLLKWWAYQLTGSVALYSDALESIVNVVAALAAFVAIWISQQPPDFYHPYGHTKAEYFSAIFEGLLILLAAIAIIFAAWERLFVSKVLEFSPTGLLVSLVASALNAGLASYLIYMSRTARSPALKADGLHILSDVITSIGVLTGVALAWLTHWWILDPLLAIVVALNILWMGVQLLWESSQGLMDMGMTSTELTRLHDIICVQMGNALQVHDIKTRRAGRVTFIQLHLVVSSTMTVEEAHHICDRIENSLKEAIKDADVTIHLEPESEAHDDGLVPHSQDKSDYSKSDYS
jgi:cation diffusion facilitator family transporter